MTPAAALLGLCSGELFHPRTDADGKLVTESNLSLRVPAQVPAVISSPFLGVFAVTAERFLLRR
jgi:hypothetical protein